MAKLLNFPITTTDTKASIYSEGLCPTLSSDVGLTGSLSGVDSEYGVRFALDEHCQNQISGVNLNNGVECFKQYTYDSVDNQGEIQLRSILTNSNRFTVSELSGDINIYYNGNPAIQYTTSGRNVQGGAHQLISNIGGKTSFPYSLNIGTNLYTVSGVCTEYIEVCANMQNTSLTGNPTLSSDALYYWNTDIAVAKIAIRIPLENSFPTSNQIIWVGSNSNNTYYGYFKTRTSTQISNSGEWVDFIYSQDMYTKQFNYITTPDKIKLYTTGITVNETPPGGAVTGTVGKVDLRVFYDQIVYGGDTIETVTLSSNYNDQNNYITKVFPSIGTAYIKYLSGSYNTPYSNDLTIFNASKNSVEYYGDKENWISISGTAGTSANIYIKSSVPSGNTGLLNVEYNFKGV